METHHTKPVEVNSPSTIAVTVIAAIALVAAVVIGLYVVAHLNEVFGFANYLRLAYGGYG